MNTNEALLKIEEINSVIQSSNKVFFSGPHMILYGIIVLMVPLIGYFTSWLTFGYDFGARQGLYIGVTNMLFFWALSIVLGKLITKNKEEKTTHPLIRKAFSISRPLLVSIFGIVFVLSATGQGAMVYPMVLILLGILFSIYGKFTIKAMELIAWSYIVCGLIHAYLISRDIEYLSFYFLAYNGLSYILIGALLIQSERKDAART